MAFKPRKLFDDPVNMRFIITSHFREIGDLPEATNACVESRVLVENYLYSITKRLEIQPSSKLCDLYLFVIKYLDVHYYKGFLESQYSCFDHRRKLMCYLKKSKERTCEQIENQGFFMLDDMKTLLGDDVGWLCSKSKGRCHY